MPSFRVFAGTLQNAESGLYYARVFHGGKEVSKSLKADVYSVVQAKLAAFLQDFVGHRLEEKAYRIRNLARQK